MNLESPVKMLLQDVKTPLVPDSKMVTECATMGSAEGKRKAEPDALAAPDAKKTAISPGLPKSSIPEDNTSLEGSSKDDENVPLDFDLFASDEESEAQLPEGDETIAYVTRFPFDVEPLREEVSKFHQPGTTPYDERVKLITKHQHHFEDMKGRGRKVRVNALLDKEGSLVFVFFSTRIRK